MTGQRDYGLYQKLEIVGVVTDGWSVFFLLALSFGCRFLLSCSRTSGILY